MKMDQQQKRVQAFPPARPLTDLKQLNTGSLNATKLQAQAQQQQQSSGGSSKQRDSMTIKVKRRMQGRERCPKTGNYVVAYDPITSRPLCHQCLFDLKKTQNQSDQNMFTALMTRDLKSRFDEQYRQYKDSLCDVAEIDHANVKDLLCGQAKLFFAQLRTNLA